MNASASDIIKLVKDALAAGKPELAKSISIATGLTWYDLEAPAKNLYPTITPLRNSIPRVKRARPGDAAHWKQVTSLTGSGWDSMGWVPEGGRSARMSYVTANKSATYVTLGEEDQITFEAEAAGEGFEDLNATITMRLLQKTMRKEEIGLLAGNAGGIALGVPATPTLSASGTGATLPALTYSVIVVALTLEGWKNSSLAAGAATSKAITGADTNTFTLNGGASNKSAAATQAVTLGQTLFASVTPIQGAVAYAWYTGAAGSETLQAITTIASVAISAPLTGGRQAATAVTADYSANPNVAFDGILTQALNPANLGYYASQAQGTAGTGTPLTSTGRGSVAEIDTMLQNMWDNYRISPTVIYVNSQEQKNITTKILSNASGPLLRYDVNGSMGAGDPYGIVAGGVITAYYNPFSIDGGTKIPVKIHPDLAPGTVLGWAERLPEWYQSNEVPNVAEILTRRDYYRMDWPLRTRQREYGIYAEEVLAVYATFALGTITNIGNG